MYEGKKIFQNMFCFLIICNYFKIIEILIILFLLIIKEEFYYIYLQNT